MGADSDPQLLFEGVLSAVPQLPPKHTLVVYCTKDVHSKISTKSQSLIQCHIVDDFIAMEEAPVASVKAKRNSSLVAGLQALAAKEIDAFVSCGNTGSVVAGAVLLLKKFPKILRPGLIATLPSKKGPVVVIDVGGSTTLKSRHLMQFALLGAAYHAAMYGTQKPTVGLLNVGIESKKGRDEVRDAYRRLEIMAGQSRGRWGFSGNVEGRELFSGDVDVIVTDGFTGNVLLKTAEGTAAFVFDVIKKGLGDGGGKGLDAVCKRFSEEQQSGALLCGVEDVVIKIHGDASPHSVRQGILKAYLCVADGVVPRIRSFLS
jgi:glycerol-3-phosphate acyltransferase PlsX